MKKYVWLVIVIIGLVFFSAGCNQKKDSDNKDIVSIEYSFSKGYGTEADAANRHVRFESDGSVYLSNDYNSLTGSYSIKKEEYESLTKYIFDHIDLFDKKSNEDEDVMDGGSSTITITFSDGKTKSVGGYMLSDQEYQDLETKIRLLMDNNSYKEYNASIK